MPERQVGGIKGLRVGECWFFFSVCGASTEKCQGTRPWRSSYRHESWLDGVTDFSFHKHLPHYAVTTEDT